LHHPHRPGGTPLGVAGRNEGRQGRRARPGRGLHGPDRAAPRRDMVRWVLHLEDVCGSRRRLAGGGVGLLAAGQARRAGGARCLHGALGRRRAELRRERSGETKGPDSWYPWLGDVPRGGVSSVKKTMAFEIVGDVLVLVQTREPPSATEWDAY